MINELAEKIYSIISDYHCDNPKSQIKMSVEHIISWANQFDDDAEFVLSELLHFLPEVYISRDRALELLKNSLLEFQKQYNYSSMLDFITNTHFINCQKQHKSQYEILLLIDEILKTEFAIDYKSFEDYSKKHYIYFDDVLATGNTVRNDLLTWLNTEEQGVKNYTNVINKNKTIAINLFCYHNLGFSNIEWALMKQTDDKIKNHLYLKSNYIIENNIKNEFFAKKQRLNCAYPIDKQDKAALEYLISLEETNNTVPTYRSANLPINETFFSTAINRNKLEKIFINKGIEILKKIKKDNPDKRKRPLGDTIRSHHTFGTGTLFFTWRNISNTCPLVFWWEVPSHGWLPLFSVKNRGL